MEVLEAIKLFSDEGLKSTGGLSNNSNGAPKNVRPIMDYRAGRQANIPAGADLLPALSTRTTPWRAKGSLAGDHHHLRCD